MAKPVQEDGRRDSRGTAVAEMISITLESCPTGGVVEPTSNLPERSNTHPDAAKCLVPNPLLIGAQISPLFILFIFYFLEFIYFRGEGRERGRETSMYGCLSCAPYWAPGPQPRHVP